jgi:hypothetical protein
MFDRESISIFRIYKVHSCYILSSDIGVTKLIYFLGILIFGIIHSLLVKRLRSSHYNRIL